MNPRRFFIAKTIGFLVVAVLVGGFFLLNEYIYNEKQAGEQTFEPYRATLSGEYICLPPMEGAESEECVSALRTDVGELYGIDLYLMSQTAEPLTVGDRIRANGVITPVERLSTDYWRNNNVQGIFSVTDSLLKL